MSPAATIMVAGGGCERNERLRVSSVLTRKAAGLGPRKAAGLGPKGSGFAGRKGSGFAGRAHVVKAGLEPPGLRPDLIMALCRSIISICRARALPLPITES